MSSTIRCVSCKQRINLAPDANGEIVCPMCKTRQKVPDEHAQNAPKMVQSTRDPGNSTDSHQSPPEPVIPANRTPQFGPDTSEPRYEPGQGGGCGCLLAGITLCGCAFSVTLLMIRLL